MPSNRNIATTAVGMRRLLAVAGTLVVIIGLPLYLVPQNSGDYFSWSVQPALSAAFLGGAYLAAGVIEFSAARQRVWANARIAVPAVLAFTLLTLFITLGNNDQYNYQAPGFVQSFGTWAWLLVYVVVPPIMAIVLGVQLFRGGADPIRSRPIPVALRGVLAAGGALLLVGGILLLIDPGVASWMWPWPVSSLTGRALGAWMVGFGIAMVQIAWEADWKRVRPATAGAGALGVLQLVAVLRYVDVFAWDTPQAWVYVAVLASFAVLGIWGWRAARDMTSGGADSPEGSQRELGTGESGSEPINTVA
ncbi:MAG: hypothetical protein U9R51_03805 [Actinomycetota bacterium]|nr:hypothetical protein [Actinomycetota bacterium]